MRNVSTTHQALAKHPSLANVMLKKSFFAFIVLLILSTGFSARAAFTNAITGPDNAVKGALLNYSYNFSATYPTSYPTPLSATLTIVGGVFVSAQGATSTTLYPNVGSITNFQVRWTNTGAITSTFSMNNIPYTANGLYSGTLTKNVTVTAAILNPISMSINANPNYLTRNASYIVHAHAFGNCEWAVTGDITMTFYQADSSIIIHTGPSFTTGSVRVRANYVVWTDWISMSLSIPYRTARSADALSEVTEIESIERIYPNPLKSGDVLHVSLGTNEEVSSVVIGDVLGNALQTIDHVVGDQLDLPTYALSPGLYMLTISGASGVRVRKFQVQ